jgi:hypothetical protein
MKVILTEQQIRDYTNNLSNITIDNDVLKNFLYKAQNDGFFSISKSKNIFDKIDELPDGDYFIVTANGKTVHDVESDLETQLKSNEDTTPNDAPTHYLIFQKNDGFYNGTGIMMTQKAVKTTGRHGVEMTPRGSHGGK